MNAAASTVTIMLVCDNHRGTKGNKTRSHRYRDNHKMATGMWHQCFDAAGWVAGKASGL